MSRFVLVHGAWHGAWCWYKMLPRLRAAGHEAAALDLPGHGIDRTPTAEITLDRYVTRVVEELDRAEEPVVLVGHSMGGIVIGPAAEARPDKVRALVYLTAIMPRSGRSGLETRVAAGGQPLNLAAELSPDKRISTVRPDMARSSFYGDCSDEDFALAQSLLVPQSMTPMETRLNLTEANFGRVRRTYIECLQDCAISLAMQRSMIRALPGTATISLDCSHSPFFSMPDALTQALVGVQQTL